MNWIIFAVVFVYMCRYTVHGRSTSNKEIVSISVDDIDYGEGDYLLPGSVKSVPCVYNNKRQQVKWIDPSGKTIPEEKSERIYVQTHQSQTLHGGRSTSLLLTFADTWVQDSGKYTCRSGHLSKTVSVCVIDPLTFVDTPSEVSVDEGRSFTLICEARGAPEPRLVWYRNDEEIFDSKKYKVSTKFTSQGFQGQLTITSIETDDAGSYTCQAIQEHKDLEDCSFSKDWNITLNVNYVPVFEGGNMSTIFAKPNESVELDCEPKAYPEPTYQWYTEVDDGTFVKYPTKNALGENESRSKVTIPAEVLSFGVKYVCEATNNFGAAFKTYTILEARKPTQPDEVTVFNYTDTQIVLKVSWDDGVEAFPIENINVQWLPVEQMKVAWPRESDWRTSIEISLFDLEEDVTAYDPEIEVPVNNLEPDQPYWIRVQVGNGLGYSKWSKHVEAQTARQDEPLEGMNVSIETVASNKKKGNLQEQIETRREPMFYGIFFTGGVNEYKFLPIGYVRNIENSRFVA